MKKIKNIGFTKLQNDAEESVEGFGAKKTAFETPYYPPTAEVIHFTSADIITTSESEPDLPFDPF